MTSADAGRPEPDEYSSFRPEYVALVPEADVVAVLEEQPAAIQRLAAGVAPDRERYRYAPGKWSIREVLGHLTDAERVFGYRAFCIGRGEQAPLPGFNEDDYVAASRSDDRTLSDLAAEFVLVREANMAVFRRVAAADWRRLGAANGAPISLRGMAFVMAGHVRHHLRLLGDRYGVERA